VFRIKISALISTVTLGLVLVGGGVAVADDDGTTQDGGLGCCRTVE
jgi:hypothetical protein